MIQQTKALPQSQVVALSFINTGRASIAEGRVGLTLILETGLATTRMFILR